LKYALLIIILFNFSACSIRNPFVPTIYDTQIYERERVTPSKPISSAPMYKATMKPYTVKGKQYCPTVVKVGDIFNGIASWYGDAFHGKLTSNGEYYNMYDLTAAHKTLPINTLVKVTNLRNNKSTTVRINDRGPFVDNRIIDLSFAAAKNIDMIKKGTASVKLEIVHFDNSANKYAHKKANIQRQTVSKKLAWKQIEENEKQRLKIQEVVIDGEYAIQIASLSFKEKANALKEKCYNRNDNYKTYIKEKIFNKQTIYKVMIGGFKSIQEAKDFIQIKHYKDAFIVRN